MKYHQVCYSYKSERNLLLLLLLLLLVLLLLLLLYNFFTIQWVSLIPKKFFLHHNSLSSASSPVRSLLIILLHPSTDLQASSFSSYPWNSKPVPFFKILSFLILFQCPRLFSPPSSIISVTLCWMFIISPTFRLLIFSFLV